MICKSSRLPVVLIRGTAVFYGDMSEYSLPKTKVFGGFIFPTVAAQPINDKKNVIRLSSVDKTIIFCSSPIKEINILFSRWHCSCINYRFRSAMVWLAWPLAVI